MKISNENLYSLSLSLFIYENEKNEVKNVRRCLRRECTSWRDHHWPMSTPQSEPQVFHHFEDLQPYMNRKSYRTSPLPYFQSLSLSHSLSLSPKKNGHVKVKRSCVKRFGL